MRQASPVTSRAGIARAYNRLKSALMDHANPDPDYGGYWTKSERLWFTLDETHSSIYVCNLRDASAGRTTMQLVFERANPTKRRAGLFVRVPGQGTFVAHSGRLGGNWSRAGKRKFQAWYEKQPGASRFAETDGSRFILIGEIHAKDLRRRVEAYVNAVYRYRIRARRPPPPPPAPRTRKSSPKPQVVHTSQSQRWKDRGSRPFVTSSRTPNSVRVRRQHEAVVDELGRQLKRRGGGEIWHDKRGERDIYLKHGNRIAVLFEVKTKYSTTDVHTGTGQLMLHGAGQAKPPVRVLVLPRKPDAETAGRLRKLGIRVLVYSWRKRMPVLQNWYEDGG